jgi:5-deoxy-glucuronate isomerase
MSEYFAKVESKAGLNTLPHNPCKLLDFQLLVLPAGQSHSGQTGDREIAAVILGGKATFEIGGKRFEKVGGRPNVFSGKPHTVYLPCGFNYTITAEGPVEIALCSAPSDLQAEPYVIEPDRVNTGVWGAANFSRNYFEILTATQQSDLPARRLIVGETFTPSGNWSTYPPHKHEEDKGGEAFHEEMYYFRINTPEGFGLLHHYDRESFEENYTIRNSTILMAPRGYHTYVGAPGYTSYYLWFLSGEHRNQAVSQDPDVGWVFKAVPMLKSLGH